MTLLLDIPAPATRSAMPPVRHGGRRILVHDYAGHIFPLQLSRWLAAEGNQVLHLYASESEAPRGRLMRSADDPPGFAVEGVGIGRRLDKYVLHRRWLHDHAYGGHLAERIAAFRPDVVLSGNTPPATQARLLKRLKRDGVPLVYWVQDIFTIGAEEILKRKPKPLRWAALRLLERTEFGTMRQSAGLVVISPDFLPTLSTRGVNHPHSTVVENWAPYGEITPRPKDNAWSRAHGLNDRFVFLCSGTLGMKHNPAHLANLARAWRDDPRVRVVVVSEGLGRRWLEDVKAAEGLDNLVLLDFQPVGQLSDVLASADVQVLLLESYAGALSVPSKVYSYFCAGRPILGALPAANLARRLVERERAGLCVDAGDDMGFLAAARRLHADSALRMSCADRQVGYAHRTFDIDRIGPRFLDVLDGACAGYQ
ncbi:glycosyltransferase family 4 protein (plasmid) [Azospirillum oryzae]|uniref:Glycosyltransferase family 4 protein n=1 Tax=Azospirillum oryzae TaxID=286727 RepID=A0A6N1ACZ8_9PROT|nr:glycosyltransferase family 4 protein [Azospirillum oryzae]KAA0586604.1 glycosyltransferase family 4 protein [Azospirillum oryzae]QKS49049.1 glycosyltransferase family 4 protein [Azospirillum oryzae]